ncbi:phage head-tail joining protein [Pandoraea sputorum]|uniref:phage head-tail joining protein n=1 Tax=Pandoraea sputorum TaxID=93222 RepID=UPI002F91569E
MKHLQALNDAIASGELSIAYDGKRIEYRSIGELIKARNLVRDDLIAQGLLQPPALANRGPGSLTVFSRD